jgi:rubrerythrin
MVKRIKRVVSRVYFGVFRRCPYCGYYGKFPDSGECPSCGEVS